MPSPRTLAPELREFINGFIECALWSTNDEGGRPLDANYGPEDLAPATRAMIERECAQFIEDNRADLDEYAQRDCIADSWASAGHDFSLTRDRHGAGFWDRGLGALGERLTDAAQAYGSTDLYVGDDGLIHMPGEADDA